MFKKVIINGFLITNREKTEVICLKDLEEGCYLSPCISEGLIFDEESEAEFFVDDIFENFPTYNTIIPVSVTYELKENDGF